MKPCTSSSAHNESADIPSTSFEKNRPIVTEKQNGNCSNSQLHSNVSNTSVSTADNHETDEPCTSSQAQMPLKRKAEEKTCTEAIRMKRLKFIRPDTWEYGEKSQLINTLKEMIDAEEDVFFSEDPDSIAQVTKKVLAKLNSGASLRIPERRVSELFRLNANKMKEERSRNGDATDRWLEIFRTLSPLNKHLEQQLKSAIMVAIEEPIPPMDNKEQNGNLKSDVPEPSYAAIYKYIACAVAGQTLPELSPVDSLVVEDCMQSLFEQIKTLEDGDLRLSLRKLYLCINKVEGQMPEEDEDDIFNQLEKGTLLNPLGINQNLIVPVPPE